MGDSNLSPISGSRQRRPRSILDVSSESTVVCVYSQNRSQLRSWESVSVICGASVREGACPERDPQRALPVPGTDSKRELVETNCCGPACLSVGSVLVWLRSVQQEDRGRLDLSHARPASPFEEVVSEPASHVQQTTLSDVAGCELSQAVVNDHGMPIGCIRGSRWAFSCKAQASPRPFAFLLREAHLGVGADAADKLHIRP